MADNKAILEDADLDNEPAFVSEGDATKTEGEMTIPPKTEDVVPSATLKEGEGEEKKPFKQFGTQEEYDEFIKGEKAKAIVDIIEKNRKDVTPEEKEEILKLFPDDFKPGDWNEAFTEFLKNPIARKFLARDLAPEIKEVLDNLTETEKKELEKNNEVLDTQYDSLAKDDKVPARSTEEGKKIDKQITDIGAKYGMGSMTDAYDLWSKLPKEYGGGLGYTTQKSQTLERKQKSGLIGNNRKSAGTMPSSKPVYKDIHGKDMDELIQEEGLDE